MTYGSLLIKVNVCKIHMHNSRISPLRKADTLSLLPVRAKQANQIKIPTTSRTQDFHLCSKSHIYMNFFFSKMFTNLRIRSQAFQIRLYIQTVWRSRLLSRYVTLKLDLHGFCSIFGLILTLFSRQNDNQIFKSIRTFLIEKLLTTARIFHFYLKYNFLFFALRAIIWETGQN